MENATVYALNHSYSADREILYLNLLHAKMESDTAIAEV